MSAVLATRRLRTRDTLVDFMDSAAWRRDRFFAFWHGSPLSQWAPTPFAVDGLTYPTAEHWMMVAKAQLFMHESLVPRILASPSPGAAKKLGRTVVGFDDATWELHRRTVVHDGNVAKFEQNDDARSALLETSDRVIVEASPIDRIWGAGLTANDPLLRRPASWPGQNLLGFVLMDVRDDLRGTVVANEVAA